MQVQFLGRSLLPHGPSSSMGSSLFPPVLPFHPATASVSHNLIRDTKIRVSRKGSGVEVLKFLNSKFLKF